MFITMFRNLLKKNAFLLFALFIEASYFCNKYHEVTDAYNKSGV